MAAADATKQAAEAVEEKLVTMQELWDEYNTDNERPKNHTPILGNLSFAADGGFSEVKELFDYDPLRWIWAAMTVTFVLLNLWSLVTINTPIILNWMRGAKPGANVEQWLLSKRIMAAIMPSTAIVTDSVVVVACFEMSLLCYWLFRAGKHVMYFTHINEMVRWHAVAEFCFFRLPELSTLSAMMVLYFVAPSILIPSIIRSIQVHPSHKLARFAFARVIFMIAGCDAFLVKVMEVTQKGDFKTFEHAILLLTFMNQMLGIINLSQFSHYRLFLFVFGGEDTFMDRNEAKKKDIWHALLAREMWRTEKKSKLRYVVLLLSYSNFDFQKIVVNEDRERAKHPNVSNKKQE